MRHIALTAAAAAAIALFAVSADAAPQPDFSKVEVKTTDLGHNTYMLEGAGGNVTVAVGTNGVIMVDAQFAPMHDKLKAAIAKITNLPVKYLINTHYHGDHTGGNAAFGKEGVTIVANEKLKDRLANPPAGANGQTPAAAPPEALPKQTFAGKTTVSVGGRTAQVTHITAHTDTDAVVYFADANVLAVGDTGGPNRYPNIALGGSIGGMISGVVNLPENCQRPDQDRTGSRAIVDQGRFSGLSRQARADSRSGGEIEGRRQERGSGGRGQTACAGYPGLGEAGRYGERTRRASGLCVAEIDLPKAARDGLPARAADRLGRRRPFARVNETRTFRAAR